MCPKTANDHPLAVLLSVMVVCAMAIAGGGLTLTVCVYMYIIVHWMRMECVYW